MIYFLSAEVTQFSRMDRQWPRLGFIGYLHQFWFVFDVWWRFRTLFTCPAAWGLKFITGSFGKWSLGIQHWIFQCRTGCRKWFSLDISFNIGSFSTLDGVLRRPCDATFDERRMDARWLILMVPVSAVNFPAFWNHYIPREYNGFYRFIQPIFGLFRRAMVIWNRICIPEWMKHGWLAGGFYVRFQRWIRRRLKAIIFPGNIMVSIDSFIQFWVFFDARWWFGTVFTCLVGWYKLLMVFTLPERRNSSCNFCGFRVIGLSARSGRKLLARSCCNDYNGPGWCSRHLRIMWDR